MTAHEILLHHLVGRTVHDVNGERVGRIHELCAEIAVHEQGNVYEVREFHIGIVGWLEGLLGGRFARQVARTLWRHANTPYVVSWQQMDLADPLHPRLTVAKASLR